MRTTLAMMLAGLLSAGVWVLIEPPSRRPAGAGLAGDGPRTGLEQAPGANAAAPVRSAHPAAAAPPQVRMRSAPAIPGAAAP